MPRQDFHVLLDTRRNRPTDDLPISMVVPVYDVAPYVGDCLRSIQTNARNVPLELIVIDDGSRDGSAAIAMTVLESGEWPETLLIRQRNQGLSATRNLGIELARGEYLGFLDSDDRMVPGGLRPLLDFATRNNCDLVMGRSRILDSITGALTPFYDAALWTDLLAGQTSRILRSGSHPQMLSLEPNANYRLSRRRFLIEHNLRFPEGLWFEDVPFHLRSILKAQRIGLLDTPFYDYRINRPGKITDQQDPRRFDFLEIAELSLGELRASKVTPEQGAAALRVLFRILWSCGALSPPDRRPQFFAGACRIIGTHCPQAWIDRYLARHRGDPKHFLLGALLAERQTRLLTAISSGRPPLLAIAGFLLKRGYIGGMFR